MIEATLLSESNYAELSRYFEEELATKKIKVRVGFPITVRRAEITIYARELKKPKPGTIFLLPFWFRLFQKTFCFP